MDNLRVVDSTVRETEVVMGAGARLQVTERLMTHDKQWYVTHRNPGIQ